MLLCTVIKRKDKADTSKMINYSYPIIKAHTHTYGLTNQSEPLLSILDHQSQHRHNHVFGRTYESNLSVVNLES